MCRGAGGFTGAQSGALKESEMTLRTTLWRFAATSLLVLAVALPALAQADFVVGKADDFISLLNKGDYQKAYLQLDSNLGFQVNPDKLKSIWSQLTTKAGNFVEFKKSDVQPKDGFSLVVQVCKFEKGLVDLHIAVNNSGQIAGLAIKDHKAAPAAQPATPPQAANENSQNEARQGGA
jgi:hypothetical protein